MNYRQRKYNEGQSARNDIYRFLVMYFEKHGYMPSYEEIMDIKNLQIFLSTNTLILELLKEC
jgi:hypothetical protein